MNAYAELARHRKASAIAMLILAAYDATEPTPDLPCSEIARAMNAAQRENAARAAGQHTPSDATWDCVVEQILAHESAHAAVGAT